MNPLTYVQRHLDRVILAGAAHFGDPPVGLWPSAMTCATGLPCTGRDEHLPKRCYRNIDAPGGSTLYWDLPAIVAAHNLSRVTGRMNWAMGADVYVRTYLQRCTASTGLVLWGNHYFYHPDADGPVEFHGQDAPQPIEAADSDGELHEIRPIRPPWEVLWRVDAPGVERGIRAMSERHVFDQDTGGFNRHADGREEHAFLESGGTLLESLAWLAARKVEEGKPDASLGELAGRVARWSFDHRDEQTGLVPVNPSGQRWDAEVCTTEIGLWGGCVLHAADLLGSDALVEMAQSAVGAYLRWAWDEQEKRYAGQVRIADGEPVSPTAPTPYQPGRWSDPWNAMFPTHDTPLSLAQTCVELYRRTGKPAFGLAIQRWARMLASDPPQRAEGVFAESAGRAIHFLLEAADALDDASLAQQAQDIADWALEAYWRDGMFAGHTATDRCQAVDGTGYLLLALIRVGSGRAADYLGFRF